MVFGSLSVVFVSFVIVIAVFFYNVKSDIVKSTYNEMDRCITQSKPIVSKALDYSTESMFEFFDISMDQIVSSYDFEMIICSPDSKVIWVNSDMKFSQILPHTKNIVKELGSKESIYTSKTLNKLYGCNTITAAYKVYNKNMDNSCIVICTTKTPSVMPRFWKITREVLLMECVLLLFISCFMYYFSKSITTPLQKINSAVHEFTKGNFEKRVEYKSNNELGELADNINTMAVSIQNLEKMRTGFISDVSHELRTPMTTISGFVEGMLDGTIPDCDREKYLNIVLSETKRLSRLVSDLLGVSRLENNQKSPVKNEFDICELAKIAILKFDKEIDEKKLKVIYESDSDEIKVYAESDSITRVLINLIHNAVKFSDEGGYIKISVRNDYPKCTVAIENSGPGISKDKLDFIWQRFYKVDDSRSNDVSGVGLGLYIVKRIIDAHNEKIMVYSEPEKYTRFEFTLDLV